MVNSDPRDLAIFFEIMGMEHFTDAFIDRGYTIDNLHLLSESDLDKLRITSHRERSSILGIAAMLADENNLPSEEKASRRRARAEKVRPYSRTVGPQERRAAARKKQKEAEAEATARGEASAADANKADSRGGVIMQMTEDGQVLLGIDEDNVEVPGFSATLSTANEAARQATVFLNHHRVDRPWPKAGSKLSQTLHLSGAAPASYEPLYSINLDGSKETVCPPHKHSQGFSAKFCRTCADFVSEAMQGAWQYQVIEQVLIGEGLYEEVPVWKPFNQTESMKIEYAHKRRQPHVKIGKQMVDFDASLWGTKPIRRVDTDAVPFPTLKKKDLVPVPSKNLDPQREMQDNIQELQRTLISETEERRSRLFIEQQEQRALTQVLADIAAMMDELHYQQRLALEDEETAARAKVEGDEYEKALDKIYEWEEQSVRDVALKKWENESARIMRGQQGLLEEMEAIARRDVEAEEAAFRANLDTLMKLFNDQVKEFFDLKRRKELRSRRNQDGKPRCPVCRKFDCDFFCHPWRGQWKHHGGVLDGPTPNADGSPGRATRSEETLSTLVNRANETEYDDFLKNQKAARGDRKAKRRLEEYLSNVSARKLIEGGRRTPTPTGVENHYASNITAAPSDVNISSSLLGVNVQTAHSSSRVVDDHQPSIDRSTPSPFHNNNVTSDDEDAAAAAAALVGGRAGRPQSAMGSTRNRRLDSVENSAARIPRPHSAQPSHRSSSSNPSLHGNTTFKSAVGGNAKITADSVNQLTKLSRVRTVRPVSGPVGSTLSGDSGRRIF